MTEQWNVVDTAELAEQPEALLDEAHEPLEATVVELEPNAHYDRADDVGHRHAQGQRQRRRLALFQLQTAYEQVDFFLKLQFGR